MNIPKFYTISSIRGREQEVRRLSLVRQLGGVFPDLILQCTHLVKLELSHNQLTALPEGLAALSHLEELDLSDNALDPTQLLFPAGLKKLSLRGNGLGNWPAALFQLTQLEELDLRDNQLTNIPDAIGRLKNLKKLKLGKNLLTKLPPELGALKMLRELDLYHNRLGRLPEWISEWEKLQMLDLSANRLRRLPKGLGNWQALEILKLNRNRLQQLPEALQQARFLRKLEASHNQIEVFPTFAKHLPWLAYLNLNHNRLRRLPEDLYLLQRLQDLRLRNNHLESLPQTLTRLEQLHQLDVGKNHLTSLFGLPAHLIRLKIDDNQLAFLPPHFPPLQEFDFSKNKIAALPPAFFQLTNLQKLNASGNPLSCSPELLAVFPQLQHLKGLLAPAQKKQLLHFLSTSRQTALPGRLTASFFRLLRGDKSVWPTLTGKDLLLGLAQENARIRRSACRYLYRTWGKPWSAQPLKKGATLFLLGKTYFDPSQLAQLANLGVQINSVLSEANTHVLIGRPPYPPDADLPRTVTYLPERQLTRWMDRKRKAHLVYHADDTQLENVRRMLRHTNVANAEMALQLLRGGGVHPDLLPDLEMAWKNCQQEVLKEKLFALLIVYTGDRKRGKADGEN